MELTTTSILALFQTDKDQRATFAQNVISEIEQGIVNPLNIHLQIKCMQEIADVITSDERYHKLLLEETDKYAGKSFEYQNAKIEKKEVGVKYDFATCNDPIHTRYNEAADKAKKQLKEREDFLKKAPSEGFIMVDEDSGETVTVYPPTKTSKTSISVSLK